MELTVNLIEAPFVLQLSNEEGLITTIDASPEIGGKNRVSEILNRKRKLTVEMIRNLNHKLNLSPGLLISDYQLIR